VLQAEGFEAYEVSNHARGEAARSRHNLVYWRGLDYVGAGPGAHGRITVAASGRPPKPPPGPPTTSAASRLPATGSSSARP
jgi:coproporphyrinogen III oxidase-like Fe-S oxidoreductase